MCNPHARHLRNTKPVLSIEDLTVSFPADEPGARRIAVQSVELKVYPGLTTAVVGESGSGKSVTALSIMRLLQSPPARRESGRIFFTRRSGESVDLLGLSEKAIRAVRGDEIAMIFQEPMTSLNPVMPIGEQIIEAIRLHRDVSRRQATDLAVRTLSEVEIRKPRSRLGAYPHEFSGGMLQRVMIAIALSCRPRILIADEPTTALDVTIQAQILRLLDSLKTDRHLGVLLITHDLGLVASHADYVVVMYAGRVVEAGPTDRLIRSPRHPYTRGLLASAPSVGTNSRRLRTLDSFVKDPASMSIRIDGQSYRAWWPTTPESDVGSLPIRDTLAKIGEDHQVRVYQS